MRNSIMILALAALVPSPFTPAHAATIYVPADQPTIQAGLDAAVDGDTVIVTGSTYWEENLNFFGKAVTLRSEHGSCAINCDSDSRAFVFHWGEAVDTVCMAVYEITQDLTSLFRCLKLNPDRMMENLQRTNGLIVAENVMMTIAPAIGRQKAHDLIHEAAHQAVLENQNIFEILMTQTIVRENVSPEALQSALDPGNYIGHCTQITQDCIIEARIAAERLR